MLQVAVYSITLYSWGSGNTGRVTRYSLLCLLRTPPFVSPCVYVGTSMTCRGQLLPSSLTLRHPRGRSGVVSTSACTVAKDECVCATCCMHTQAHCKTPLRCPGFFFLLHILISVCILQKHIACCIVQIHLYIIGTIPFQLLRCRQ